MNYVRLFLLAWLMSLASQTVAGFWQDLWITQDQQGKQLMDAEQYAKALQTFQRADWRATAAYRAGLYQQAAQYYAGLKTADGFYNAGNALAKLGQYPQAIQAYDQALAMNPQHQDALFNRKLIQTLLDEQQKNKPSQQGSKPSKPESKSSSNQDPSTAKSDPSSSAQQPENKPDQASQQPPAAGKKEADPKPPDATAKSKQAPNPAKMNRSKQEQQQAKQQWLRLIPDEPGGLLREKFLRDHLRRQGEDAS